MTHPTRNSLAIVGAGPVGLEAAVAALDAGLDVHVFERGEIGDHVRGWGHVRMFTPWRTNVGPHAAAALARMGEQRPDGDELPTGAELVERLLEPLARLPELATRIHAHSQVVAISRQRTLQGDVGRRAEHPFRLLVRDVGGRENFLHAFAVIDASGVYGHPNFAGDGGIPARNELYLAPQLSYHLDDVLGMRRERYAGKAAIVVGAGASAATLVADLARLADEVAGTSVTWVTRKPAAELYRLAGDPLPARRALYERARALMASAHPAVRHIGGVMIEGMEFNSATHRYRLNLAAEGAPQVAEGDQVLVAAGYGPDREIHRELQIHECYVTRAPMKIADALRAANASDGSPAPALAADMLDNPEAGFWILGHKSFGRSPHFLLENGYQQVAEVIPRIASAAAAAVVEARA